MLTQDVVSSFLERLAGAATEVEIAGIEQELLGRKHGVLTLAMQELGALASEEKRVRGQEINAMKQTLLEGIDARRGALASSASAGLATSDRLDITLDAPATEHGHLHLIHDFIEDVKDVFGRMGFDVGEGPEVDDEEHNFDLLNFPRGHAARDAQDIFYINGKSDPENRPLLRGHTSTVQVRYMQTHKPPFRVICPGKVYRKDDDATHSPMFHQFEGLMIGPDVSLANMKAVMMEAIRQLISEKAEFRFRTGYFPFVEPGLEVDMRWQGDESQSREGRWLEIAGCGMVHPNVLKNCGIDANKYQGFAFGFGVERMVMIKHQIPDLRSFTHGDMRFLRQF